jgi:hypothetical protein
MYTSSALSSIAALLASLLAALPATIEPTLSLLPTPLPPILPPALPLLAFFPSFLLSSSSLSLSLSPPTNQKIHSANAVLAPSFGKTLVAFTSAGRSNGVRSRSPGRRGLFRLVAREGVPGGISVVEKEGGG